MNLSKSFRVERVGDTLVLVLGGRIGSLSAPELVTQRQALVETIRESDPVGVVVDFANVEYFGSFVLDTLCVVWKQVTNRSGEMCLCNLSSVAREVVHKSRLNLLWPVYSSLDEAIESFRESVGDDEQAHVACAADSKVFPSLRDDTPSRLDVIEVGQRIIVGFNGGNLPPEHVVSRYLEEILALIEQHDCQELAFEMEGISHIPSGFLGVVTEIFKRGIRVSVRNPSADIREVFEISHLDQKVHLSNGA